MRNEDDRIWKRHVDQLRPREVANYRAQDENVTGLTAGDMRFEAEVLNTAHGPMNVTFSDNVVPASCETPNVNQAYVTLRRESKMFGKRGRY